MKPDWPYMTPNIPGVPGTIRAEYGDFRVAEIPSYLPSGKGTHVYFTIEKTGLSTGRAVRDIARQLEVRDRDIGMGGLKDARGVTIQTLSVEHVSSDRVASLDLPRIKVLSTSLHTNKFKIGHTRGNRFIVKMRDADLTRMADIQKLLDALLDRGVPNYFGPQRFGNRGDTWEVGKALLEGRFEDAAAIIAGNAGPADEGRVLAARQLFDSGDWASAAKAWPRGFHECTRLCHALARDPGKVKEAVLGLGNRAIKLYVSALQSRLFNDFLARRIDTLDRVETGDLAWKHENGAVFRVADPELESPRAEAFEISPTGPLFGPKMTLPQNRPLDLEEEVLCEYALSRAAFTQKGPLKCAGGRRPLRVKPEALACNLGEDGSGSFLQFQFTLPPGAYATAVFREIGKDRLTVIG